MNERPKSTLSKTQPSWMQPEHFTQLPHCFPPAPFPSSPSGGGKEAFPSDISLILISPFSSIICFPAVSKEQDGQISLLSLFLFSHQQAHWERSPVPKMVLSNCPACLWVKIVISLSWPQKLTMSCMGMLSSCHLYVIWEGPSKRRVCVYLQGTDDKTVCS